MGVFSLINLAMHDCELHCIVLYCIAQHISNLARQSQTDLTSMMDSESALLPVWYSLLWNSTRHLYLLWH